MTNLVAARWQMGLSLAFHIVFAVIGMAMPVMMVVAESLWLCTGRQVYLDLTKRWARGTAIFFAVGAVSGTVLSFELGLLWPRFMELSGGVIGMPFSLEGFAFFLEAIFLGVYLYGWSRAGRGAHLFAGVVATAPGACSGMFVVTANAWMNTPAGFRLVDGRVVDESTAAMMNPLARRSCTCRWQPMAAGLAVAGVHARMLCAIRRALDARDRWTRSTHSLFSQGGARRGASRRPRAGCRAAVRRRFRRPRGRPDAAREARRDGRPF